MNSQILYPTTVIPEYIYIQLRIFRCVISTRSAYSGQETKMGSFVEQVERKSGENVLNRNGGKHWGK